MRTIHWLLFLAAFGGTCRTRIAGGQTKHVAADTRFMQGMIGHHAQALEMVALIPARTSRAEMRLLGQRIDVSQRDEIKTIRGWLMARHEGVPDTGTAA